MSRVARNVILMMLMIFFGSGVGYAQTGREYDEQGVLPWEVGQFVCYQIITMEGASAGDRYQLSIVDKEEIGGHPYYWVLLEIWEDQTEHGYNVISERLVRNISFKMLLPPLDPDAFFQNPARLISEGVFFQRALKLMVKVGQAGWHEVDPVTFFVHNEVLDGTPYRNTPHGRGMVNLDKLKVASSLEVVHVPAGVFACVHYLVDTTREDAYWQEGFDLWRSKKIPLLGFVKMEFSNTKYWEKLAHQSTRKGQDLASQRVLGRTRPDIHTLILLDYGPKK